MQYLSTNEYSNAIGERSDMFQPTYESVVVLNNTCRPVVCRSFCRARLIWMLLFGKLTGTP